MRQLPVINAVSHSFSSMKDNLAFAFNISWPWMLVLMPLNTLIRLYPLSEGIKIGQKPDAMAIALIILMGVVNILAYSSIAVNWHRYVLKDEVPVGVQRLRLDSLTHRYFLNAILIVIIIIVLASLASIPTLFVGPLFSLPFMPFVAVTFYRLSVKLPAIALDRDDFDFVNAWKSTQGNFLGFFGLFLILALLSIIVFIAMISAVYILKSFGVIGSCIFLLIQTMLNWITTIFGITILTSLYGYFVEERNF
jgi:hypothetical protein